MGDSSVTKEGAGIGAVLEVEDRGGWRFDWLCEQWSEEAVDFCRRKLEHDGTTHVQDGTKIENGVIVPQMIPIEHGIPHDILRKIVGEPENIEEAQGNLLLNEGIQRMLDMTMIATVTSNQVAGNPWSNANAYIGVGDTATAEAATQTELLAAAAATNRFYKIMSATYPIRTNQSVDFRADFTSTEANFVWNEWTVAAGATTASGAGFLTGTINLNRKVQSLGTKSTGTWTMTGTVTIS
jgi:hypothetical protein